MDKKDVSIIYGGFNKWADKEDDGVQLIDITKWFSRPSRCNFDTILILV